MEWATIRFHVTWNEKLYKIIQFGAFKLLWRFYNDNSMNAYLYNVYKYVLPHSRGIEHCCRALDQNDREWCKFAYHRKLNKETKKNSKRKQETDRWKKAKQVPVNHTTPSVAEPTSKCIKSLNGAVVVRVMVEKASCRSIRKLIFMAHIGVTNMSVWCALAF